MFAIIENNVVVKYPANVRDLISKHPNVSFGASMRDADYEPFGMFRVFNSTQPAVAADETFTEGTPVFNTTDQRWEQQWIVRKKTAEELAEDKRQLLQTYDQALSNHLDATAQSKRYDNRISCALRAGYPGPFQAEGQAFAAWMDNCNALAYKWWDEINKGTKPMFSSTTEFIAALPTISWPE